MNKNSNFLRSVPLFAMAALGFPWPASAQDLKERLGPAIQAVEPKVIAWRRDIHQNPELSNRETRTAALVAEHLRKLGLEVRTGVARTGVVGILKGGKPGPVVALRADMDALPVTEATGLPFASKVRSTYNGQEVGVMHACGHDAHTAILMGVAEVLAGIRKDLPGTVQFFFQPAEEGPPPGEEGGAKLMVKEGVLDGSGAPEAIFGLHVGPGLPGNFYYRAGGSMAAADIIRIKVEGRQTHGASPWQGIDPITVAAQIITALQTIPSRQLDVTKAPVVVTIGRIQGGVRSNIIPDSVDMEGTLRTLDKGMREEAMRRIRLTAENVAEASGAKATVTFDAVAPVTYNDPELTRKMLPTLQKIAGPEGVREAPARTGAEDFSYFQEKIPGFFFFLGTSEPGVNPDTAPPNHSPLFTVNEKTLTAGVRALAGLAIDYLNSGR
jgi:amidohydrolase